MTFTKSDIPITEQDITEAESTLNIKLPPDVRDLYLSVNGGVPEPYVFEDEHLDTVVSKFLPLKSLKGGTAVISYNRLVLDRRLVPRTFFPFAVDGGGDYFFIDSSVPTAPVYFYRSDCADGEHLLALDVGFKDFWTFLKEE